MNIITTQPLQTSSVYSASLFGYLISISSLKSKTWLLIFPFSFPFFWHTCMPSVFLITGNGNSSLQVAQAKNLGVVFDSSLLTDIPHPTWLDDPDAVPSKRVRIWLLPTLPLLLPGSNCYPLSPEWLQWSPSLCPHPLQVYSLHGGQTASAKRQVQNPPVVTPLTQSRNQSPSKGCKASVRANFFSDLHLEFTDPEFLQCLVHI